MLDLIHSTEETHYENYRRAQMETRKIGEPKVKTVTNPKWKEEEEALRKRFTEQVRLEENRFRSWEQQVRTPASQIMSPCSLLVFLIVAIRHTYAAHHCFICPFL
jgi:septin family protein